MKKRMLSVLALLLAFSLAACAGNSGSPVKSETAAKMEAHSANLDSIQQKMDAIAEKTAGGSSSEATEAAEVTAAPAEEPAAAPAQTPAAPSGLTAPKSGSPYYDQIIPGLFFSGEGLESLQEMEFALDRVLYSMPFSYSDLLDFGWTGEFDPDEMLDAREETWIYLTKGGTTVSVGVYNTSHSEAMPLSECDVVGIEVNADDLDGMEFTIAKGITLSSAWQEIVKAYGEDKYSSDHEEDDAAVDLVYDLGGKYSIEMSIDNEYPEDNEITLYFDLDS